MPPKQIGVPSDKRADIIRLKNQCLTYSQIAKLSGYNISTIKAIISVYRREGRVEKKLKRDKPYHVKRNYILCLADSNQQFFKPLSIKFEDFHQVVPHGGSLQAPRWKIMKALIQRKEEQICKNLQGEAAKIAFIEELDKLKSCGLSESDFENISELTMANSQNQQTNDQVSSSDQISTQQARQFAILASVLREQHRQLQCPSFVYHPNS